ETFGLEAVRGSTNAIGGAIVVVAAFQRCARRPGGGIAADVNLFALGHHGEARERIRVLTADQRADAAHAGCGCAQTSAIAGIPDELFVERRHELAVMDEDLAVGTNQQVAVPQSAYAGGIAFRETDRDVDTGLSRRLAYACDLRAISENRRVDE